MDHSPHSRRRLWHSPAAIGTFEHAAFSQFATAPLTIAPSSTDARRYFKQSEIILYRQAPDAEPLPNAGTHSLPAPPENKLAAASSEL